MPNPEILAVPPGRPAPTGPGPSRPIPAVISDIQQREVTANESVVWHLTAIELAKMHVGADGDYSSLVNSTKSIVEGNMSK